MEILAEVLGGPAVGWVDGSLTTVSTDCVVNLTDEIAATINLFT
jgi:hypothetical protein